MHHHSVRLIGLAAVAAAIVVMASTPLDAQSFKTSVG